MKIRSLFPEVDFENEEFEYKAKLENDKQSEKWGKTLVGYANENGGEMFVGVSNDGEAFGLSFEEIDKYRQQIYRENDRRIIPHIKIDIQVKSVDS
ncbi:MAG: ATP-binding protein [Bacilli bacterium]|jgi:predicted HTH transcriptional regulator|nr:ATP-binding protein [Bacilli bacterium]